MRLLKNMKAFSDYGSLTYIMIALKTIQLVKDIFVLDVEQGDEIIIPMELDQSNLNQCYKFYNPTLKMIQEWCSREKKDFFNLKNALAFQRADEDSKIKRKLFEMIGIEIEEKE